MICHSMLLILTLLSSLQRINSTYTDNEHSKWLPVSNIGRQTGRYSFHNTNAAQARGKRETDNQPSNIDILYLIDNNRPAGMPMSSKGKRCQGELTERKVYGDHHQKGTSSSNYVNKEDNANYYKSVYPSFTADEENRRNFEFAMDNDDMQDIQVIAIPQAIDNNFNANIPQSLASYIQLASKSKNVLQLDNGVQQLMTFGNSYQVASNSLKKKLMNNEKESELNKDTSGTPSNDENGYIHAAHLNELNTNMNTQAYSHLLSDTSTNPNLQYGFLRSGSTQEYYHPYGNTESWSQTLNERENLPLEESMHSKSTLPGNHLYPDKNFPQQTTYNSHRYDNGQTMDSDMYENRLENIYSKNEEENEYQDIYNTYTRCSHVNPGLMHSIKPVTNYELPPIGQTNEHTLKKPTGTKEDIIHNKVLSDILLYPVSDNRQLTQGKSMSQNGLTSSYVQENPGLKHNTVSITNSELLPIRYASEYSPKKPLGTNEDITHNKEVNDILFYPSSDKRRLMQNKSVPQNGLTSSPCVQEPHNMQRYHPGNPSAVLQEDGLLVPSIPFSWQDDGLLVQSIPNAQQKPGLQVQSTPDPWRDDELLVQSTQDEQQEDGFLAQSTTDGQQEDGFIVESIPNARAKEASTYYNEIPYLSSHVFKFLTSQVGMSKKDSRLTTTNSILSLPTADHNTMPTMSHIPYHYRDMKEVLNNMDISKLNFMDPKYHDDNAEPHYFIQKNKIPSPQLPNIKEIDEVNEELQFTQNRDITPPLSYIKETNEQNEGLQFMQYGGNTLPQSCTASTITNVPKRPELMTDHSKYTQWVANTSPNRDEPPRYLTSINGINTVQTHLPFQIPTYNMIKSDDNLSLPQKPATSQHYQKISTPSNNMNMGSVALQSQSPTSIIQLQLAHHKPINYRLREDTYDMKFPDSVNDRCSAPTGNSDINYNSKCSPSTAIPRQNEERSEILLVPEVMRSDSDNVSSSVNHDGYFVPRSDSSDVEPSSNTGIVSGRTKNKFSHTFQNTKNDSHYLPASVVTSFEHTRLSPTPTISINVQARSKSEDTFRQTVNNTILHPAELKESFTRTYSAATFSPLKTTVTMGTYLPETYTEITIMDDYENKTIMRQDIIPTVQLNGDYETTHYSATKMVTSEEYINDESNSTTELPHGFKHKSSNETTRFSESFQNDTKLGIAEKEMKKKWNVESEQSTTVMPNLHEAYEIRDGAHPTTNGIALGAITDDTTEHTASDLLNNKLKIQLDPIPQNTLYQTVMSAEIPQQQDTYYNPSNAMTDLLTEKPYSYISDVADIMYVNAKRQDDHSRMAATVASSNDKETNPVGLVLPDKTASSENKGNYNLSTVTTFLPENITNIVYVNTQLPESLEPTHKETLNEFYTTTVMPQPTEFQETTDKRTVISKKAIKYKQNVSTQLTTDKPIITTNAGHRRKNVIFESGKDQLDKITMADKFPQNYEEQINAHKDTQMTLQKKTTQKYVSPGTLTSKTSRAAEETYQTALHIPNKMNTHASTLTEKTTFPTVTITSEIMKGIFEVSVPTERSHMSQSVYFTTPYETEAKKRSTTDLHKPNNDNSWILQDGLQYLHADNYGTSQSAIFTTTPYVNYNNKMRSTLNTAIGGWNQKNVQDVAITQHRTYFHNTDMPQELATTSEVLDDANDGTDKQGVLQSQVVTKQTEMNHAESKRNAVKQSDEDVTNETDVFKKKLMLLFQNNDKIKLLLDSPNSNITSAPSAPTRTDGQSHMGKEPVTEDQEQTEVLKLALSKLTPANLEYNSIEKSHVDHELKNAIMDSLKSEDLPPVSLPEKKRQTKSSQDIHRATAKKCKIIHTSKDKHNLKYQDTLQQPSISEKEHPVPSLKGGKSETTYKITTKPKQNLKLTAGFVRSDDVTDTAISLAHLPRKSDMRAQRSTCGPWPWYKNYICMPVASPKLNDHQLLSNSEHINTVPVAIYEMNINSEPEYDYEMDSSLESSKTEQEDILLNSRNQQSNIHTDFQHSDTLGEENIMMNSIIHNNNEENQNLYDDSMTDIYNVLDSPQLPRLYMYTDRTGLQPKLYTKRRSNSYHNTQNIPEENYQQVIQNSIVSTRPVLLENWKKYGGLVEEIIQPNPSTLVTQNYNNPHTQHLSHVNNNEENARALLIFKKRKVNKESYDDNNEEITYSKSGRKKYHQPSEQEILKAWVSQSLPFGEKHDEFKDPSEHEDNSKEYITSTSSERDLRNVKDDYITHTSVSDASHDNKIFNQHNNNYEKKVLAERTQKIPPNQYQYYSNFKYSSLYHNPSVKDKNKQNDEIHQTVIPCLLDNNANNEDDNDNNDDDNDNDNNNNILQQPEDNYSLQHVKESSSDDEDETNEHHSNNVVRRMRHVMQYPTASSFEDGEKELYPIYKSSSCQSYNCKGVLISDIKTVTSILNWLKKIVTDTKKT